MSNLLDTKTVDMTVGDQLKVGMILTAATVGVTILATSLVAVAKVGAEKLAERQNNKKDTEEQ